MFEDLKRKYASNTNNNASKITTFEDLKKKYAGSTKIVGKQPTTTQTNSLGVPVTSSGDPSSDFQRFAVGVGVGGVTEVAKPVMVARENIKEDEIAREKALDEMGITNPIHRTALKMGDAIQEFGNDVGNTIWNAPTNVINWFLPEDKKLKTLTTDDRTTFINQDKYRTRTEQEVAEYVNQLQDKAIRMYGGVTKEGNTTKWAEVGKVYGNLLTLLTTNVGLKGVGANSTPALFGTHGAISGYANEGTTEGAITEGVKGAIMGKVFDNLSPVLNNVSNKVLGKYATNAGAQYGSGIVQGGIKFGAGNALGQFADIMKADPNGRYINQQELENMIKDGQIQNEEDLQREMMKQIAINRVIETGMSSLQGMLFNALFGVRTAKAKANMAGFKMEMSTQDAYKILGLDKNVTPEQIKSQYRKLAKQYHPDAHYGESAESIKQYEIKMKEITNAYDTLFKTFPAKNTTQASTQATQNNNNLMVLNPAENRLATNLGVATQRSGINTNLTMNNNQINKVNKSDIKPNIQDIQEIELDTQNFSRQVDEVIKGTFPNGDMLVVCKNTPKMLKDIGLTNLPITMTQKHLDTIMNETGKYKKANYHNLGIDIVKQLPEAISNPLDIVKSNTKDDSIILTTHLADKNNNTVIASIKLDGKGTVNDIRIDTNVMTSAYGKDNYETFMKKSIENDNILYDIDRGVIKKVTGERLQLPIRSNFSSVSNVPNTSINNSIQQNDTTVNSYSTQKTENNTMLTEDIIKNNKIINVPTDMLEKYIDRNGGGYKEPSYLNQLKESIKTDGRIKKPVRITAGTDGTISIVDGNHRIAYAKELGLKEVPIKYTKFLSDTFENIDKINLELYNEEDKKFLNYIKGGNNNGNKNNDTIKAIDGRNTNNAGKSRDNSIVSNNGRIATGNDRLYTKIQDTNKQSTYNGQIINNDVGTQAKEGLEKSSPLLTPVQINAMAMTKAKNVAVPDKIKDSGLVQYGQNNKPNDNVTINANKIENKERNNRLLQVKEIKEAIDNITDNTKANKVSYFSDFYRNMRAVFGEKIANQITGLFDNDKLNYYKCIKKYVQELEEYVVGKLGISKGSKNSKLVQQYGEKKITLAELQELAPEHCENIVKADEWFRKVYNNLIDKINEARKTIYPNVEKHVEHYKTIFNDTIDLIHEIEDTKIGRYKIDAKLQKQVNKREEMIKKLEEKIKNGKKETLKQERQEIIEILKGEKDNIEKLIGKRQEEQLYKLKQKAEKVNILLNSEELWRGKIIPKRKDYYRHFQEMAEGFKALHNILNTPTDISSNLAGISEWTKPKSKFLSLGQKRLTDETKYDAVGGFLDYIPSASYSVNIDPFIADMRELIQEITVNTTESKNANTLIEYLTEFTNILSGKTTTIDRGVQKYMAKNGRKIVKTVNWVGNRLKANAILGNLNSTLSQALNLPQIVGEIKSPKKLILGLYDVVTDMFHKNNRYNNSQFITERYFDIDIMSKFDTKLIQQPKKIAQWLLTALDAGTTKMGWNALYRQALEKGIENPIQYVDNKMRDLVGGRGIGERTAAQESNLVNLFVPFTVEVGNFWRVMKDMVKAKDFAGILITFLTSYLLNSALKTIGASGRSYNPIGDIETAIKEDENIIGALIGGILSNHPIGQTLAQVYPEYGADLDFIKLPTREKLFGSNDPTRFGTGSIYTSIFTNPIGSLVTPWGGKQLQRTAEGIKVMIDNGLYKDTAEGKKLYYPFDIKNMDNTEKMAKTLQLLTLGKWSTTEAKRYFEEGGLSVKQTEKYIGALQQGINGEDVFKSFIAQKGITGTKDAKGNTINLSASKNKKKAIDDAVPNLTKKQKEYLYEMFNVSEKVYKKEMKL